MRLSTAFLCLVLCALGGISQSRFLVGDRGLSEDGARTVPRCLGLTSCYIVTVKVLSTEPRKLGYGLIAVQTPFGCSEHDKRPARCEGFDLHVASWNAIFIARKLRTGLAVTDTL